MTRGSLSFVGIACFRVFIRRCSSPLSAAPPFCLPSRRPLQQGLHSKPVGPRRASEGEGDVPMAAAAEVPSDVQAALRRLYHEMPTPVRVSIITTGAGGHVATWMLGTPGASNVLVDLNSPYSTGAVKTLLGGKEPPGPYCSSETALALAKAAYQRAVSLSLRDAEEPSLDILSTTRFLGIACSAAVVSTAPKKGDHRAYIAVFGDGGSFVEQHSLKLTKGARDRIAEDYAVSKAVLAALLQAADAGGGGGQPQERRPPSEGDWISRLDLGAHSSPPPAPGPSSTDHLQQPQEEVEDRLVPLPLSPGLHLDPLDALSHNTTHHVLYVPSAQQGGGPAGPPSPPSSSYPGLRAYPDITLPFPVIIYPGSFNPLHEGHRKLAAAAQARVQQEQQTLSLSGGGGGVIPGPLPVVYELASLNADKGWVGSDVLRSRLWQFSSSQQSQPVVVTRNPLFVDKAKRFPGAYFLIGADTVKRLVDTKYYGHSVHRMVLALSESQHLGCRFVVGGRVEGGKFLTLEDVLAGVDGLPDDLRGLFIGLSEKEFRLDISSTEIRAKLAAQQSPS